MKKILVLGGGSSAERDVSIRSAKNVLVMLVEGGYKVQYHDYNGQPSSLSEYSPDDFIVFPIIHGASGEDGVLQDYLDHREFLYLGSNADASAQCFDKQLAKETLTSHGVPMPKGEVVTRDSYEKSPLAKGPHVLKPLREGSSIGTFISKNGDKADPAQLNMVFARGDTALLEKCVVGTESTVGVLGESSLEVVEIIPPQGKDFDTENKYNGESKELSPPKNIPKDVQNTLKELALKCHTLLGCRHYSRVDIMLDESNNPYVLEVNTIPGMTKQSLFPKSARAAGYTDATLAQAFVDLASKK